MDKDFEPWHTIKSTINRDKKRPFFHERDVWFASLGFNVGLEQDGKGSKFLRPIVIIKKFNNETLWGITLTSKNKIGKYYFTFNHGNNRTRTANLSQLKLFDSKRLKYKTGLICENDFKKLKECIIKLL